MKSITIKILSIVLILCICICGFAGCFGKFMLTKKLYKWNSEVGDKWMNSMVMWIFFIIPVYEVVGFVDFAILNVIEFYSGENPVKMTEGEQDIQFVEKNGKIYRIMASKNRFDVVEMNDDGTEKKISLVYEEEDKSWYVESESSERKKIAQVNADNSNILSLIHPDGQNIKVNIENNSILEE